MQSPMSCTDEVAHEVRAVVAARSWSDAVLAVDWLLNEGGDTLVIDGHVEQACGNEVEVRKRDAR
jgi:hypothetical protein